MNSENTRTSKHSELNEENENLLRHQVWAQLFLILSVVGIVIHLTTGLIGEYLFEKDLYVEPLFKILPGILLASSFLVLKEPLKKFQSISSLRLIRIISLIVFGYNSEKLMMAFGYSFESLADDFISSIVSGITMWLPFAATILVIFEYHANHEKIRDTLFKPGSKE